MDCFAEPVFRRRSAPNRNGMSAPAVSRWAPPSHAAAIFRRRRSLICASRDFTCEAANLAVVDDEFIVVLTRAESRQIMRSLTAVGGRVAMVASGVGKAVLATYSDEDVSAIIRHHGMPRLTENPLCARANCSRNSKSPPPGGVPSMTRKPCIGLRCVAAVVYNDCAEPLAAISVSGMTSRLTDERLPLLGQTVREVAAELTVALGGVMPAAKAS
jgi:IclR family acetate operon transcriptional repressor